MVVPADYLSKYVLQKRFLGGRGEIIGSLVSHIGVLYYCFEEILVAGKLSKVWYWYNKLGLRVRTYRDQYITWISFEE